MFIIDADKELSREMLYKIISKFETECLPKLKRYRNYYQGKQDILLKHYEEPTKPCNRIVTNYCDNIVQNFAGYLAGMPIGYTSDSNIEHVQEVLNYNDVRQADVDLLLNALIYGVAYEVVYVDEQSNICFKALDSQECIPIYDNTIARNLLYVMRYYSTETPDGTTDYYVEVYSKDDVKLYKADIGFVSVKLIDEHEHFFEQVPISVMELNNDRISIFDKIMPLQDAYNTLLSAEVDDFQAFCDAYMVLCGADVDDEDLISMREKRTIILPEEASVDYLNKSISDTQIQNMLQNVNDAIHKISNSPDFNDEKLLAQSGIAMKYKLIGFENVASSIVQRMTKALQKRIELICAILNLTGEATWRDVQITFTRNLPANDTDTAQIINQLRGVVSNKTLVSQLSFVHDVDAEIEQLEVENQNNISMYNFGSGENE